MLVCARFAAVSIRSLASPARRQRPQTRQSVPKIAASGRAAGAQAAIGRSAAEFTLAGGCGKAAAHAHRLTSNADLAFARILVQPKDATVPEVAQGEGA